MEIINFYQFQAEPSLPTHYLPGSTRFSMIFPQLMVLQSIDKQQLGFNNEDRGY